VNAGDPTTDALFGPVLFAQYFLQHELWDTQADPQGYCDSEFADCGKGLSLLLKDVHGRRSNALVLGALRSAIVITMASKFEQVVDELWCKIRKAIRTSRIRYPEPNQTKHCPRAGHGRSPPRVESAGPFRAQRFRPGVAEVG